MKYNSYAYVINHYNLISSKKFSTTKVILTTKSLTLIKALHSLGAINSYVILTSKTSIFKYIRFSVNFYKNEPYYRSIKLISKPSQSYNTKKETLSLIHKSLGVSSILLNTPKGILDSKTALRLGVSGPILCILN